MLRRRQTLRAGVGVSARRERSSDLEHRPGGDETVYRYGGNHSESDVEAALDAYVQRNGGARRGSVGHDNLKSKLLDKLRGRAIPKSADYYELPRKLFDELD